jgi:hypothetical protein
VAVADRPKYIKDMLYKVGASYVATDYTAFESLFVASLMDAVEFELYEYMTQNLPDGPIWVDVLRDVLMGDNKCYFKYFKVKVPAKRMSGEMNTSLGNGFSNLMFFGFLVERNGGTFEGCVEGDDGIFRVDGTIPPISDFEKLGLRIKLETHIDLCTASFCGIIFDPDECINVTDPREVMASFGWTTNRYSKSKHNTRMLLLRAKSLSYLHQYPGCPIIQSLALYGLRMTRSYDVRGFVKERMDVNMWEREQLIAATKSKLVARETGYNTRLLVEKMYGLSVELQLRIESYIDSLQEIQPLEIPCTDLWAPQPWIDYWSRYACYDENKPEEVNVWVKYSGFKKEW